MKTDGYRIERDTMGEVRVPSDKYWGAQTQRSYENFRIGDKTMPMEIIYALANVKLACARVNRSLLPKRMTEEKLSAIEDAVGAILRGELDSHFPLSVFQTGSGTQTNMNLNEVIANYANEKAGAKLLHPNDDVNMSQSSNDTFPTAMHIAAVLAIKERLLPELRLMLEALLKKEEEYSDACKIGRTHLQDAVPMTFGQEISGWRSSLLRDCEMIEAALPAISGLALGATAVGTGLNAPVGFDSMVAKELSEMLNTDFHTEENKFHSLSSKCELVNAHGALKALGCDMMKMANDVRWLSSGPRCGLGEIFIPENEPGSSIMPGKVNPTQCEAVTMVACRVIGNDTAISLGASSGNFQLNVFMPLIIDSFLCSARLITDSLSSFRRNCARGIRANREKMKENLDRSLMTATALTPIIGYEATAKAVHLAHERGLSIKEAVLSLGIISSEELEEKFNPEEMVRQK